MLRNLLPPISLLFDKRDKRAGYTDTVDRMIISYKNHNLLELHKGLSTCPFPVNGVNSLILENVGFTSGIVKGLKHLFNCAKSNTFLMTRIFNQILGWGTPFFSCFYNLPCLSILPKSLTKWFIELKTLNSPLSSHYQ